MLQVSEIYPATHEVHQKPPDLPIRIQGLQIIRRWGQREMAMFCFYYCKVYERAVCDQFWSPGVDQSHIHNTLRSVGAHDWRKPNGSHP